MKSISLALSLLLLLAGCGGGSSSPSGSPPGASSDSSASQSSESSSSASSPDEGSASGYAVYGLYVSALAGGDGRLLGNAQKEQEFLDFLRDNGFNYLILYDLEGLQSGSLEAEQLASLIHRARTEYGVVEVAAALGSNSGADNIVQYNSTSARTERFDVLNVEYEFWNQPNRELAFDRTIELLEYYEQLGQLYDLETEIYIGWITEAEGIRLAQAADRILVHFYRTSDEGIIQYGLERLEYLAAAETGVRIAPIFSNEGPENTNDLPFMGEWLETHPHDQALRSWLAGYNELQAGWQDELEVMGGVWFIYDKFLDLSHSGESHIVTEPQDTSVCEGDAASFSVISAAASVRYCWVYQRECLQDEGNLSGTDTDTLVVENVTEADVGGYYARVVSEDMNNPVSFASREAQLSLDPGCS